MSIVDREEARFRPERGFSCFSKRRTGVCLLGVVGSEVGINLDFRRFLSVFKIKENFDAMERPEIIGTLYVRTSVLHTDYPPTISTIISVIITKGGTEKM